MQEKKYKLSASVFYRLYGDKTVLYDTEKKKIYVFNQSAGKVFDCFKEFSTLESCCAELSETYRLDEGLLNDIKQFVDYSCTKEILISENVLSENKNDLESRFKHSEFVDGKLLSVQIELTFRCNEKCRHCYCVASDVPELSTKEVFMLLDKLREMDVFDITFTGGDLFVRADAFDLIEYAVKKGFAVNIFTNGIALTDSDLIKLKSYHPKSIHFSIYSHIPEKHDYFTQVKGSFEKTVDAIRKCVLLKIPTNIKTCVMNYNADDIEGILRLAEELGTTIQVSMSICAKNDGDITPTQFRLDTVDKYTSIMKKVNRHMFVHCSNEFSALRLDDDDYICGAGRHSLNINPYGDVFACNSLLIKCGNIRETSISDIWANSEELKQIREMKFSMIKGCENCSDVIYCNYCPGNALTETGDPLKRYDEACMLTKSKKNMKKGGV